MRKAIAALIICALVLTLGGCIVMKNTTYSHAGEYTAGAARLTAGVKNIDVEWLNGAVVVETSATQAVEFSETTLQQLDEKTMLHYWLDGDTLRIRFAASGVRIPDMLEKTLTLTLPESLPLSSVSITSVSANVNVPSLSVNTLRLRSVSGVITVARCDHVPSAKIESVSGSIAAEFGDVSSLEVSTVSGEIVLNATSVGALDVSTVSGNTEIELGSVSSLEVGTVSGEAEITLVGEFGFTMEFETVSGGVTSDLALQLDDGRYIYGDGGVSFKIKSVSGNVKISMK